jgi:hypothetical protein
LLAFVEGVGGQGFAIEEGETMSFRPVKIKLKKSQWLTSAGHVIEIKDMDDQHIVNTLNYVESHTSLYKDRANQYLTMLEEAKRRKLR